MMKKIRVGSDFSGVGAFDQALKRLDIDYESVFACDIDKYARITYLANNPEPNYFPMDVYEREIPEESLDVYMTSPPCQSFSMAGKRLGEDDDRGILFYNSHEFIKKNKPRFFIFENVKGLLSSANGRTFGKWIEYLGGKSVNGNMVMFPDENSVPYHIYWTVLNAKDYNIPQNRERVFIVGIRDDEDNNFSFPKPMPLQKRLKDILEVDVDEKYYLSETMVNYLSTAKRAIPPLNGDETNLNCIVSSYSKTSTDGQYLKVITNNKYKKITNNSRLKKFLEENKVKKHPSIIDAYNQTSNSNAFPCISTRTDASNLTFVTEKENTNKVIVEGNLSGGKWDKTHEQSRRVYSPKGIAATLHTMGGGNQEPKICDLKNDFRIRKLTPRECFRAMDFPDTFDISKVSNSQAYKQAGNSIAVGVLAGIINNLKI